MGMLNTSTLLQQHKTFFRQIYLNISLYSSVLEEQIIKGLELKPYVIFF